MTDHTKPSPMLKIVPNHNYEAKWRVEQGRADRLEGQLRESRKDRQQNYNHYKLVCTDRSESRALLTKFARAGEVYCSHCHGTTRNITGINSDWDAIQIRLEMDKNWLDFNDAYPNDCEADLCYDGFELQVPE